MPRLDLGCTAGNWPAVQRRAHPGGPGVRWCGPDASEAMLAEARGKLARTSPNGCSMPCKGYADCWPG